MTREELENRKEKAERETLIISRTDDGFRVYSPEWPTTIYTVSGSPEEPRCSCPDFEIHQSDPEWRCKHILAVLNQLEKSKDQSGEADPYGEEERRGNQEEGQVPEKPEKKEPKTKRNGASQMVIKRSISPDGRIDSLSVVFACPLGKTSLEEIKSRAVNTLKLQAEIVKSFLEVNGKENGPKGAKGDDTDGSLPAQMLRIGGMNGKWGWRYFIDVDISGRRSKLFGTRKELAGYITAAGFPNLAERIENGLILKLPCRVIAKPSDDGRFLNIEKVLPIEPLRPKDKKTP